MEIKKFKSPMYLFYYNITIKHKNLLSSPKSSIIIPKKNFPEQKDLPNSQAKPISPLNKTDSLSPRNLPQQISQLKNNPFTKDPPVLDLTNQ